MRAQTLAIIGVPIVIVASVVLFFAVSTPSPEPGWTFALQANSEDRTPAGHADVLDVERGFDLGRHYELQASYSGAIPPGGLRIELGSNAEYSAAITFNGTQKGCAGRGDACTITLDILERVEGPGTLHVKIASVPNAHVTLAVERE